MSSDISTSNESSPMVESPFIAALIKVAFDTKIKHNGTADGNTKVLIEELDYIISLMQAGQDYDKDMLEYLIDELDIDMDLLDTTLGEYEGDEDSYATEDGTNDDIKSISSSFKQDSLINLNSPRTISSDRPLSMSRPSITERLSMTERPISIDRPSITERLSITDRLLSIDRPSSRRNSSSSERPNLDRISFNERLLSKEKLSANSRSSRVSADAESFGFRETLEDYYSSEDEDDFAGTEEEFQEIELEIELLEARIKDGSSKDIKWLHELYAQRANHPVHIRKMEEELLSWRISVRSYCQKCLKTMRSFIPVTVFDSSPDALQQMKIPADIAKRICQRQCLWLIRMPVEEIVRLHDADLISRFNSSGQGLDVIELAAIYACVPERFLNDRDGKKQDWRDDLEKSFRQMLSEWNDGTLPQSRIRAPVYEGFTEGPITDLESVREYHVTKGTNWQKPRKSFQEVCAKHSILRGMKKTVG